MKHPLNFPSWANQSWFAQRLFPDASPGAARTRLSRKLSGHRAWTAEELTKLGELFVEVEDESMFSDECWKAKERIFGPEEDD